MSKSEKKLFVVEAISMFRHTYVIEAKSLEHAYDEVTMRDSGSELDDFEEVSQRFLGETISNGRQIKRKEFNELLETFKNDKDESTSWWMGERLIRKIDYKHDREGNTVEE
jgi:hypothetical protein